MAGRWVPAPRVLPHKCALDNQSGPESGPYFDTGFEYHDPRIGSAAGLAPQRLFISARYMRAMYNAPGCLLREQHEDLAGENGGMVDALNDRISELEIENERLQTELMESRNREDEELAERIALRLAARNDSPEREAKPAAVRRKRSGGVPAGE